MPKQKQKQPPKQKSVDIGAQTRKVLDYLNGDNFEGVDIEAHAERQEEWSKDYAIFIMLYDAFDLIEGQSKYLRFDADQFRADVKKYFTEQYGEDVEIKHYPHCDEWEIIRRKKTAPRRIKPAKKKARKPSA